MQLFSPQQAPLPPFTITGGIAHSWRWDAAHQAFILCVPHGELIYFERFFNTKVSDRYVEYFQENDTLPWINTDWRQVSEDDFAQINFQHIRWQRDHIKIYGNKVPLPRLTAWYGDAGTLYTYSGITSVPNPWNKGLLYIKHRLEQGCGFGFNSVLLNWYLDGEDHMGWHADDEVELGKNPVIASVNFGETRDFILRNNADRRQKIVFPLCHGSVLIMAGAVQHYWQHSVPKRKRVSGSRFNLTFRQVFNKTP